MRVSCRGISLPINAAYIDWEENFPFWCKLHLKVSFEGFKESPATRFTSAYQLPKFSPWRPLRKETFNGTDPSTVATVVCLYRTMLYRLGYLCWSVKFPNHLSSQNLVACPLLTLNIPLARKRSLTFINPDQKCESPGFLTTCPKVLLPKYFFLKICCHIPSSFNNLNNHLLSKHLFWISMFLIPKPPKSLGWHRIFHLANLYFFFCWSDCQKKSRHQIIQFFKNLPRYFMMRCHLWWLCHPRDAQRQQLHASVVSGDWWQVVCLFYDRGVDWGVFLHWHAFAIPEFPGAVDWQISSSHDSG